MRIELVINTDSPEALTALREGVATLRAEGHTVQPHLTFEAGDAERFAAEAASKGVDRVAAAGGDGTVNEVLNGLLASESSPALAIIPLGTANDLAAELEIPADPAEALRLAVEGTTHAVDVASVNGRHFLNVSTGGLGAEVTSDTSDELKRLLGPVAYAITGVRKFAELRPFPARFSAGDELFYEGEFLVFAVGNARRTGGGNRLTSAAEMGDGLLDLCVVEGMSLLEFARIAPLLRSGRHVDHPQIVYRQVRSVTVEAREELQVNADGEPISGKRFDYQLTPRRLNLVSPRSPDAS
jgi:diacylglycerol kinase (ATP)